MVYYVLETQTNEDGTGAILPAIIKTDLNEAEAAWHRILQYAAVSSVYKHGAVIITEDDITIKKESYKHVISTDQEANG